MLTITIPSAEYFDENKCEFITLKGQTLQLEHSLVSLQKWEAKWHKPFLSKDPKTPEEELDYFRCMTLTQNVDESIYRRLTPSIIKQIKDYVENPMTATTINRKNNRPSREIITAEIIYNWMIQNSVPFECRKWHLNQLLTLIEVCAIKGAPADKMTRSQTMASNTALNKARRKMSGSKG